MELLLGVTYLFIQTGYIPVAPDKLSDKDKCSTRLDLLRCPFCGWEDSKCDKLDKKIHKRIRSSDLVIPCPKYMDFVDKPLKECKDEERKDEERKDREKILDNIYKKKCTNPNFPQLKLSNPTTILTDDALYPQSAYTNQQTQVATVMQSKPQLYTEGMKLSHEQSFSKKQVGTNIKDCDKAMRNTISISRSNVDPSLCKCATLLQKFSQPVRERREEIQSKFVTQEESKEVAVNTVQQCNKKIQNSMVSKESTSTSHEPEWIDTSAINCFKSDSRNVVGIRLKVAKCSKSNFLLITIDGNRTPLHVDCKKSIDKAEKDSDELEQKGQKGQLNVSKYIALGISYLINSIRRNWYIFKIYM
jgi:hypothetical protein